MHAPRLPQGRVERTVDAVIKPLMAEDRIPGLAIGIISGDRSYVFNYGTASLQSRSRVDDATLFEPGSISKTFTASLASYAQNGDRLSLAKHVDVYLPELQGTPFGRLTLLDLATHTSGGLPLQVPDNIHDAGGLMQYLKNWRPPHEPETYRTYTNVGIGMLGAIAAKSMHAPFSTVMERQIFPALGLRSTFVNVPRAKMDRYAEGYTSSGTPIRMAYGVLYAEAYGVRSTARDMVRFLEANMALVKVDPGIGRALVDTHTGYFQSEGMMQDLIWEQYPYPVSLNTLLAGNSAKMILDSVPARKLKPPLPPQSNVWIDKTGSTNGFGAYVAFIPGRRLGIVLLANENYPISDRVTAAYRILSAIGAVSSQ